jgi:hypothetical protein
MKCELDLVSDGMHFLPRRGKILVAPDEIRGNENDECI